jgi:hypothetical protein
MRAAHYTARARPRVKRATQTRDNAIELGTLPPLLRRKVAEAGPEFAARQRNSLIGGQEQLIKPVLEPAVGQRLPHVAVDEPAQQPPVVTRGESDQPVGDCSVTKARPRYILKSRLRSTA